MLVFICVSIFLWPFGFATLVCIRALHVYVPLVSKRVSICVSVCMSPWLRNLVVYLCVYNYISMSTWLCNLGVYSFACV